MNKLNDYYNKLTMSTSAEDMAKRVISAETAEKPKLMVFRKPAVIAAAAAVVMVGGVTAGAATGLFNFNEIFGRVSVEDEAFGESLIGNADNVITTTSDKDYAVELKGVTGSGNSILASVEISRTDGTAMNASHIDVGTELGMSIMRDNGFMSGGSDAVVTEQGTIQIDIEMRADYTDFINNDLSVKDKRIVLNADSSFNDGGEAKQLSWNLEFNYHPSEESVKTLNASALEENCDICLTDGGTADCDVSGIALTSMVGIIKCNVDCDLNAIDMGANDVKLIKKDGTEVAAVISSFAGETDEALNFVVHYYTDDTYFESLAVDVSEIEAISINGTVYELS